MKILISGSSGFIGKRLVKRLESLGHEIRVISTKSIPGKETFIVNLEKNYIPSVAFKGVDIVFHLAGYAHDLDGENKMSSLFYEINVKYSIIMAKLAINNNVKSLIYVSSVKAGGPSADGRCRKEDKQGVPHGIYGETKLEAEKQLLNLNRKNMHLSIIRPSLVYGPGAKGNLSLMRSGIKQGWFPPLPETGNKRSMIHVDDLVRAIILIANNNQTNGEIYNATDGAPHSSREIYISICKSLSKSIPRWSMPIFIFKFASLFSKKFKFKFNKLLGNECYSSKKLQSIGFEPQMTLKEINEKSF